MAAAPIDFLSSTSDAPDGIRSEVGSHELNQPHRNFMVEYRFPIFSFSKLS
jgi:hypothetical protein